MAKPAQLGRVPVWLRDQAGRACLLRLFPAPGLARRAARNSPAGRVLITSFFSSQPRRAMVTPWRIKARLPGLGESVEITTLTLRSLHMRRDTTFRARRSEYEVPAIGP